MDANTPSSLSEIRAHNRGRALLVFVILVALMIGLIWGIYFWDSYQGEKRIERDAQQAMERYERYGGTPKLESHLPQESSDSSE